MVIIIVFHTVPTVVIGVIIVISIDVSTIIQKCCLLVLILCILVVLLLLLLMSLLIWYYYYLYYFYYSFFCLFNCYSDSDSYILESVFNEINSKNLVYSICFYYLVLFVEISGNDSNCNTTINNMLMILVVLK